VEEEPLWEHYLAVIEAAGRVGPDVAGDRSVAEALAIARADAGIARPDVDPALLDRYVTWAAEVEIGADLAADPGAPPPSPGSVMATGSSRRSRLGMRAAGAAGRTRDRAWRRDLWPARGLARVRDPRPATRDRTRGGTCGRPAAWPATPAPDS
jgi:hypothetical protein